MCPTREPVFLAFSPSLSAFLSHSGRLGQSSSTLTSFVYCCSFVCDCRPSMGIGLAVPLFYCLSFSLTLVFIAFDILVCHSEHVTPALDPFSIEHSFVLITVFNHKPSFSPWPEGLCAYMYMCVLRRVNECLWGEERQEGWWGAGKFKGRGTEHRHINMVDGMWAIKT